MAFVGNVAPEQARAWQSQPLDFFLGIVFTDAL
jgi:hypothetical protein